MGQILTGSKELIKGRVTIEQLHDAFDWKVEKDDLYRIEDHQPRRIDGFYATVRVNSNGTNSLGVVKSRYEIIQNATILNTVSDILGFGAGEPFDYHIKDNGAKFNFRLLFPKYLVPNVNDESDFIQLCLSVRGSHDGSSGLTVQVQPLRKVCLNGLITLGNAYAIQSVRHTRNADQNLGGIRRLFENVNAEFDLLGQQIDELSRVDVNQQQIRDYAKIVLDVKENDEREISTRLRNQLDAISTLARRGKGNHGETLWDAYNGLTEYVDHYRGTDNEREWNATSGTGSQLKRRALEVALEYASIR